ERCRQATARREVPDRAPLVACRLVCFEGTLRLSVPFASSPPPCVSSLRLLLLAVPSPAWIRGVSLCVAVCRCAHAFPRLGVAGRLPPPEAVALLLCRCYPAIAPRTFS